MHQHSHIFFRKCFSCFSGENFLEVIKFLKFVSPWKMLIIRPAYKALIGSVLPTTSIWAGRHLNSDSWSLDQSCDTLFGTLWFLFCLQNPFKQCESVTDGFSQADFTRNLLLSPYRRLNLWLLVLVPTWQSA